MLAKPDSTALAQPMRLLLPYQQRWLADPARVKVCEKSRRIGITWATAGGAVANAMSGDGRDWWFIGYNEDAALEFIRDCAWWVKTFSVYIQENCGDESPQLTEGEAEKVYIDTEGEETSRTVVARADNQIEAVVEEKESILAYQVRFVSGFRITALTSRPRNLRGKKGHVIVDEAAYHDDLPGLRKAALALLIWGGTVSFISTHNGVDNDFNKLCEDVRSQRFDYSLHKFTFREAIGEGLYRRICLVEGTKWTPQAEESFCEQVYGDYGDDAAEELDCIPNKSGGAYINRVFIEARMQEAPVLRLELEDEFTMRSEESRKTWLDDWIKENVAPLMLLFAHGQPTFYGQDFGRTSDLSVVAPSQLTQNLRLVVPWLIEMRNVPYDQQKQLLEWIVSRLPNFTAGKVDGTGNGSALGEFAVQKFGATRFESVKLSEAWYSDHLPPFKASFEDDRIAIPRDLDVLQDLAAIRVIDGVPKLPKHKTSSKASGGKRVTRHGDSAIALVLTHAASKTPALGEPVIERVYNDGEREAVWGDYARPTFGGM